jgi:hypothetical protein
VITWTTTQYLVHNPIRPPSQRPTALSIASEWLTRIYYYCTTCYGSYIRPERTANMFWDWILTASSIHAGFIASCCRSSPVSRTRPSGQFRAIAKRPIPIGRAQPDYRRLHDTARMSSTCETRSMRLQNETQLSFNDVAQHDAGTSVDIGRAMRSDSAALKAVFIVTLISCLQPRSTTPTTRGTRLTWWITRAGHLFSTAVLLISACAKYVRLLR